MGTLTVYTAGKLLATDNPRIKSGLLLPFGEPGSTNRGKLLCAAGSLTIPPLEELDPLTLEHNDAEPVALFRRLEETDAGLECEVEYLPTRAGTKALAELESGERAALSVELDDHDRTLAGPTIRDGKVVAGLVTGGSQVERPAFASAKLAAADAPVAPDQGDAPPAADPPAVTIDGGEVPNVTAVEVTPDLITITTDNPEGDPPTMETAKVTASAHTKPDNRLKASLSDVCGLLGQFHATQDRRVLAALADVTPANILGIGQPQYIDEAWSGSPYVSRIVPAFNHADLTDFTIDGWEWEIKPDGGDYAGSGAAVPTNTIKTKPVGGDAERWAMGHGFDLRYKHFPRPSLWESYFKAGAESYARWRDLKGLAIVRNAAPYVAPGAIPAGVNKALTYIVDGIIAILNETETIADGALVATNLWRDLMLVRNDDMLAYLNAALNFDGGELKSFAITPTSQLGAGEVLVKCRPAVTFHELPGVPIRAEALAIANGKIDEGMFGYLGSVVHNAKGLALVAAADPLP